MIKILDIDRIPKELKVGKTYKAVGLSNPHIKWKLIGFVGSNRVELETTKNKYKITTQSCNLRLVTEEALEQAKLRIYGTQTT